MINRSIYKKITFLPHPEQEKHVPSSTLQAFFCESQVHHKRELKRQDI